MTGVHERRQRAALTSIAPGRTSNSPDTGRGTPAPWTCFLLRQRHLPLPAHACGAAAVSEVTDKHAQVDTMVVWSWMWQYAVRITFSVMQKGPHRLSCNRFQHLHARLPPSAHLLACFHGIHFCFAGSAPRNACVKCTVQARVGVFRPGAGENFRPWCR